MVQTFVFFQLLALIAPVISLPLPRDGAWFYNEFGIHPNGLANDGSKGTPARPKPNDQHLHPQGYSGPQVPAANDFSLGYPSGGAHLIQSDINALPPSSFHYGQPPPQGYSHSQVPAATPQIPNDFASGSASGGAQNPSHLFRPNINALPYSSFAAPVDPQSWQSSYTSGSGSQNLPHHSNGIVNPMWMPPPPPLHPPPTPQVHQSTTNHPNFPPSQRIVAPVPTIPTGPFLPFHLPSSQHHNQNPDIHGHYLDYASGQHTPDPPPSQPHSPSYQITSHPTTSSNSVKRKNRKMGMGIEPCPIDGCDVRGQDLYQLNQHIRHDKEHSGLSKEEVKKIIAQAKAESLRREAAEGASGPDSSHQNSDDMHYSAAVKDSHTASGHHEASGSQGSSQPGYRKRGTGKEGCPIDGCNVHTHTLYKLSDHIRDDHKDLRLTKGEMKILKTKAKVASLKREEAERASIHGALESGHASVDSVPDSSHQNLNPVDMHYDAALKNRRTASGHHDASASGSQPPRPKKPSRDKRVEDAKKAARAAKVHSQVLPKRGK